MKFVNKTTSLYNTALYNEARRPPTVLKLQIVVDFKYKIQEYNILPVPFKLVHASFFCFL